MNFLLREGPHTLGILPLFCLGLGATFLGFELGVCVECAHMAPDGSQDCSEHLTNSGSGKPLMSNLMQRENFPKATR